MTKPDWKDAPKWAQWLAQDEDGEWRWHSMKPEIGHREWISASTWIIDACTARNNNWRDTLERRP